MPTGTAARVLSALEKHDLKEESPGRYRANSPLRPGSNSHAFTLAIDDAEHGAYHDFVTDESGSLYDLARQLGIEIEARTPVASTKRAYAGINDYAEAHGITGEYLRKAGWYETTHQKRPALTFKTATGQRWRFLDDKKPHYKSETGYRACWYGLTPSLAKALADGRPLIICNGEISAVAARFYGVAAVCVTGGERAVPPDLIEDLKSFLGGTDTGQIIVALDCDQKGIKTGPIVARQLKAAGFSARAVDLGLGIGGDLADFCMIHRRDVNQRLLELPAMATEGSITPPIARSWYVIPAADLAKLPPIEWIVKGEIPERGVTVLFGASGAGKSFLALDYALTIAQSSPVVYMAGEGEYGYRQRVAAWCKHHTKAEGQLYMCIGAVQLLEPGDLDAFLAQIKSIKPIIVVIDTMARSMVGSDENSTRDMGLFIQALGTVRQTLNCAVLVIHHTNKEGVFERGSSALRGASDAMIRVSAEDDLIRIECSKTKDAQPFPTRYAQIIPVPVQINDAVVDSAVIVPAEKVIQSPDDPLTNAQTDVLRILNDEPFGRKEIAELTNIPYNSLQRVLSRLKQLGYVQQPARNEPYQITATGKARLNQSNDRYDRIDQPFSESISDRQNDHRDQPDHIDHIDHVQGTLLAAFGEDTSDAAYYQAGL